MSAIIAAGASRTNNYLSEVAEWQNELNFLQALAFKSNKRSHYGDFAERLANNAKLDTHCLFVADLSTMGGKILL
jgi:hypothetical protein